MIDRKVQMLDAGMVMFRTDKPFGIALGGIVTELKRLGKVQRYNEIDHKLLPPGCEDCDLFLDWSNPLRKRYVSFRLEEIEECGTDAEGNPLHRYAASFREGSRNTALRIILFCLLAAAAAAAGLSASLPLPRILPGTISTIAGLWILYLGLRPSSKTTKTVRRLSQEIKGFR